MIDALVLYIERKGFTVHVQPRALVISKFFQGEYVYAIFVPMAPWPDVLFEADAEMCLITESIKELVMGKQDAEPGYVMRVY